MYMSPRIEYKFINEWLQKLVGREITPINLVRQMGRALNRRYPIDVKLHSAEKLKLEPGQFSFGGEYDVDADEIKATFKADGEVKRALASYLKDHQDEEDDDEGYF